MQSFLPFESALIFFFLFFVKSEQGLILSKPIRRVFWNNYYPIRIRAESILKGKIYSFLCR